MLAAIRADAALFDLGKVDILDVADITAYLEAGVMILGLVCAAGEVVSILKRLVKQHGELLSVHADGADEARIEAAILGYLAGVALLAEVIGQLRLVDVKIASDEYNNIFIGHILLINDRLAGLLERSFKEFADILYRVDVGGIDLLKRLALADHLILDDALCGLHIGSVIALGADGYGILTYRGEQHIFM